MVRGGLAHPAATQVLVGAAKLVIVEGCVVVVEGTEVVDGTVLVQVEK